MRLIYDRRVGAAYLRLRSETEDVSTVSSKPIAPPGARDADDRILLDFDDEGRLVGIEFLTPDQRLLPSVLSAAESPDAGSIRELKRSCSGSGRCPPLSAPMSSG
jgi:uncharacterized protein YuzE